MPDDVDQSISLQEQHLLRAIALVTGRPPRIIEIPPPHYGSDEDGQPAGEMETNG